MSWRSHSAHALGSLEHGAQHAAHPAVVVDRRAVIQIEPGLLRRAAAFEHEARVAEYPLLAGEAGIEDLFVEVPGFRPCVMHRPAQDVGMPVAADLRIAVVIKDAACFAPDQGHAGRRAQDDIGQRPQDRRPRVDRAERCAAPVPRSHQLGCFSVRSGPNDLAHHCLVWSMAIAPGPRRRQRVSSNKTV